MCSVMDRTDNKNEEIKINFNGNVKVETPPVETQDDCEPNDRPVESDSGVSPELENAGQEKCSIPELLAPVVEKKDDFEPDSRPVESDAVIIPKQENTGQEKNAIPELRTPVVEEQVNCEPDSSPVESKAGIIIELENTLQEKNSIPEHRTPLVKNPDDNLTESDAGIILKLIYPGKKKFYIPELPELRILEYANKKRVFIDLVGGSDVASDSAASNRNKESDEHQSLKLERNEPAVASTDTNLNDDITKGDNQCLNDVGDISNSQETTEVLSQNVSSIAFTKKIKEDMDKSDAENYVDPDTVCGIGSFKPQWLQPWATAKVYLVLYSIIGILSGSYYSYLIGSITTLEKRFAFKSKLSGLVMVVDEITPLFLGVLVGYFGGRAHRPRMVALGMMMSSLACFVSALPYFIYGAGHHLHSVSFQNTTEFAKCEADVKVEECDADDRPPTLAAVLFLMIGSFLKGFGNLAYYAVGLAYMDDNAKKKNTPMYFALAYALRLLGPLVGFLMTYSFLKYYENPFVDPGFGPEDPRWIGGWWMGFMLQGVLLVICSVPIALFPRRLPGHKLAGTTVRKGEGLVSNLAGLWAALRRLGKNPLYIFLTINTIFSIYGGFGHFIMLPKYMENQFRVSASQASLLSGPPSIAALIVSTLIGGYLIYRFRPNAKFLTGGLVILDIIGAVGFLILMTHKCESIQMSNYGWDGQGLILEGPCNSNCSCSTKAFTPVCAPDGKTRFFSPCHAGCHEKVNKTFTECSCLTDSSGLDEGSTTEGFCITDGCWNQAINYMIQIPIVSFIVNLLRVAITMVLLRSIKNEDKSVALGTFETFVSAFALIPYPVVFGALVDSACLVWEKSCGQTGNCWFYDINKFNYLLHGASFLFSGMSAICMFVVFRLSGRMNDLYKDDEDIDENAKEQNVKPIQEDAASSMT